MGQYHRNNIVLSCRLAATKFVFEKFTYVQMAGFDAKQIKLFVQNWFGAKTQTSTQMLAELDKPAHKGIWELTQTPLLLTLLCIVYQGGKFPSQRYKLYEQAVEYLLLAWDESRDIQHNSQFQCLSLDEKEKLLAEIAYSMFEDGQYLISQEELNRKIRFYFSSRYDIKLEKREVNQVIADVETQHGLWVQQTQEIFSFSHLTLQEYFTAQYIVKNQAHGTVEQLMAHVGDERWREVFLLVAGMLGDGTQFCQVYLLATAKLVTQEETVRRLLKWGADKSAAGPAPALFC